MPEGMLYIASDLGHEVVRNVDPLTLQALDSAQRMWTTEVTGVELEQITQDHYASDLQKFVDLVGPRFDTMPDYLNMRMKSQQFERVPADPDVVKAEFVASGLRLVGERNAVG